MMPISVWAEPDFRVAIQDYDRMPRENNPFTIDVAITNFGTAGKMNVEAGIYKTTTLRDWGLPLSVVYDVSNCESYQTNVDTKEITLAYGESIIQKFNVIVPDTRSGLNEDNTYGFTIYAGTYLECYSTGNPTGQTDWDTLNVNILSDGILWNTYDASCEDGIKNQDETDTDCGGDSCKACLVGYLCAVKDDCVTDYCDGRCAEVPDIDGDGKPDYDKTGASTPLEIKFNEFIETVKPYLFWGGLLVILILIAPRLLPSIFDAFKGIVQAIRGLVKI